MPQTIQHRKKIDQSTHEKKEFVFRAKVKEKNQRLIDVPEIKEPITRNFETIKLEDLLTTINEQSKILRQEDVKKEIIEKEIEKVDSYSDIR